MAEAHCWWHWPDGVDGFLEPGKFQQKEATSFFHAFIKSFNCSVRHAL
jgi:hypothetical protein